MPLKQIRFGTSGWRGIIADDFTFDRVAVAVAAIADTIRTQNRDRAKLLIGYDTRFLSEEFARTAADQLSRRGVQAFLCQEPTSTPTIAYEILRRGTDGAINFTASHNPPDYNGLKFSTADGAPALPEVTQELETRMERYRTTGVPALPHLRSRSVEIIDPRPAYLKRLAEKVAIGEIKRAGVRVVYDPLYGTGTGTVDSLLLEHGIDVQTLHGNRDVLFGGHPPEPAPEILTTLRDAVRNRGAAVGLATDGDADRFGVLDGDGSFISPNHILALLLDYLLETRPQGPRGVARSVSTTHLIDAVAKHYGIPVYETPVGFKYIGKLLQEGKIILGGEESAGLSIFDHLPEKDGILACLLVGEMVARRRASLREQLEALFRRVGAYYPVRINLHLPAAARERVAKRLQQEPTSFNGRPILKVNRTDGLKLFLDHNAWVLLRLSGTEPVVRCYCEASSEKETQTLVEAARKFLGE